MSRIITRGTTPYHRFNIPIAPDNISKLYITYSQYDKVIIEKSKSDCTFIEPVDPEENWKVQIHLSQEDTLKFKTENYSNSNIEIQMTIKTISRERITSKIIKLSSGKVLKDEEI